jgi:hypothetical protein
MALAQADRKIYFIPVLEGDFDYGAVKLDEKLQDGLSGSGGPSLSFLVSYDLKTGTRRDLGLLRTAEGRRAYGTGGARTDSKGRLWFVGAFEESDPARVARPGVGKHPYSMGLGCYTPTP